jgi:hypothetical protein
MMILHRQRRRTLPGDIARFGPTTPKAFEITAWDGLAVAGRSPAGRPIREE